MSEIQGGWAFTSYGNREAFAMEYARAFSAAFAARRMEDRGTYPGNARNAMIEMYGDQRFIEAGNLAVFQCHGNPYSIDLEYVPSSTLSTYVYRWGERGKLQWVLCGGCDVLGFPVFPDGSPANRYPDPRRWEHVFQGITGILGYRSSSWYSASNPGLGAMAGTVLAEELVKGRTFWNAWIAASDFLHRRLGHRAEACVFANSVAAVSDTLSTYVLDRTLRLDHGAVRRQVIGHGQAPTYHYCERVDNDGNYVCDYATHRASRTEIAERLTIPTSLRPTQAALPTFEQVELPTLALNADREYKFPSNDPGEYVVSATASGIEMQRAVDSARRLVEASAKHTLRIVQADGAEPIAGRLVDLRHQIWIDGTQFDLIDDFGVVVESDSRSTLVRTGWLTTAKRPSSNVVVGWNYETIFQLFRLELMRGSLVEVEHIATMYRARSVAGRLSVVPVVVCYATISTFTTQRNVVIDLN